MICMALRVSMDSNLGFTASEAHVVNKNVESKEDSLNRSMKKQKKPRW